MTSTQARVLKLVCVGLAGLVGLIFIGAKLFPAQGNGPSHYMTAEQEKACFNAHMAGDEKLAAVICSPDQWRDAPQGRGK